MMQRPTNSTSPSPAEAYGPEVLCAGWFPATQGRAEPASDWRQARPAAIDDKNFLSQFYRAQNA